MAQKKSKGVAKKVVSKKPKPVVKVTPKPEVKPILKPYKPPIAEKDKKLDASRNELIGILREKLLTNEQLKRGGSGVRGKHIQEQASYQPTINEINHMGLELGYSIVSIGSLRR